MLIWKKTKWTCAPCCRASPSCCARAAMPRASKSPCIVGHAGVPQVIRADEGRLRQVITNLMGNAVKFTEKGGVCVEVRPGRRQGRQSAFLRFEVRDTGVGVPPCQAPGDFPGVRPGRFQPCPQVRRHRALVWPSPSGWWTRWAARSASTPPPRFPARPAAPVSGSPFPSSWSSPPAPRPPLKGLQHRGDEQEQARCARGCTCRSRPPAARRWTPRHMPTRC